MDVDGEVLLGVLLDSVTDTRLELVTGDEARAVLTLLGALEEVIRSEGVREAAGEMRFRLCSHLALPTRPPRRFARIDRSAFRLAQWKLV
ncbi:hypothetical protein [Streptomyces sp. NPDC058623]|uniref:hypothetical protein n=1 Tax=Streptomyces sp. NPDC058623 TaxID=3346563 RepID=UPI00365FF7C1